LIYAPSANTISINKTYILTAKSEALKANEPVVTGTGSTTTYNDGNKPQISASATLSIEEEISYQWYKTVADGSSKELIPDATSATYITDDTNAGTYYYYCEVTATRSDNHETATTGTTVEVLINKATPIINATDEIKEYTGSNISLTEPTITNTDTNLTITYTYCLDANCLTPTNHNNSGSTTTGGAPLNPGKYYVKITTLEASNYKSASKIVSMTILDDPKSGISNPQTSKADVMIYISFMINSLLFLLIILKNKKKIKKYTDYQN